jgi:hypothetical protein
METFLSLLRMAIDRGWTLGALLAIFFGGILLGPQYGLPVPAELQAWSAAGMLFGVAVLLVSLASHIARGFESLLKWWSFRRHLRRTFRELTTAEKEFLRQFIVDGENTAYEPIHSGVAGGLVGKHIIYRASHVSVGGVPGILFPYNLQPYARKALNKNPALLD